MSLSTQKSTSLPTGCLTEGLRSAGLVAESIGKDQLGVRDVGAPANDPRHYWFIADVSRPDEVAFYSWRMHERIQCESVIKFVPRMREAAQFVQAACSKSGKIVTIKEKWTQDKCGT